MIEISMEFVLVLLIAAIVIAVSSSPRVRATLLTIFGVLGFGLIALAVIAMVHVARRDFGNEIARVQIPEVASVEVRTGEMQGIQLDGLESLPPSKSRKSRAVAASTVVAKKPVSSPAKSQDAAAIEELPLRPAEPIRIDDQTRAEIERQWREDQLHDRLLYTGTGSAALLGVLATVFGYLKLDMLSRAKHRRSLQAGAAGVILAVALVAALAAEGRLGF